MTWYNPKSWFVEKLNPAQDVIANQEGTVISTDALSSYSFAFDKLESVNRGTSMIVNAASSLDFDIKDKISNTGITTGIRQKTLASLLNYTPNPYQSTQDFRSSIFTDFVLEGNIFIYYDGAYMYHLPASSVYIQTDPKTFVAKYTYNGTIDFRPEEIIHIRDIDSHSIYRGSSRLASASRTIEVIIAMQKYQQQFFDNGAMPSLILTSENTLSDTAKEKTIKHWQVRYSPKNGAKKPMILDSGLRPAVGIGLNFQEMDFDTSIKTHDIKILKALGVPAILLDGGNNANISPNLRLFYLETVMPIVNKLTSALERFFGYDIEPITASVSALQPDIKETSAYYTSLVNGGIITANEARVALRYPEDKDPESSKLRIPANIAGSASNPSEGGAPPKKTPADGGNAQ